MPFETLERDGLVWLSASVLDGVRHGFSTRQGGVSAPPWNSLNLRLGTEDRPEHVAENYRRLCAVLNMDVRRAVLSRQTHSANIRLVTEADAGKGFLRQRDYTDVDALITNVPNLPLVVFSADCGTLLLHDPVTGCIGAIHAGWRGCAAGIVEKTVSAMVGAYGVRPEHLRCALGPCIGPCCFETDGDVPAAMRAALGAEAEPYLVVRGPKWHVDLAGLNRRWLLRAGVLPEHVDVCGLCTACRPDLFWSHRRMGEARGVQGALIMRPAEERP